MSVLQHAPLRRRRCTISGWMPALLCLKDAPIFRPMLIVDGNKLRSGGWTIHELSLENFYSEHLLYRNTWSGSNCGFDLARYHGTKLTLFPAYTSDYIVFWDVDYQDAAEFQSLLTKCHPALLLGRPNTRVVLSKSTTGKYKPRQIYLPPPARYKNEWETMATWSKRKLGVIGIVMMDLMYPWIPANYSFYLADKDNQTIDAGKWWHSFPILDWKDPTDPKSTELTILQKAGAKTGGIPVSSMWWNVKSDGTSNGAADQNGKETRWLDGWPALYVKNKTDDYIYNNHSLGETGKLEWASPIFGPFVIKDQRTSVQVTWTYRSFWEWGGDIVSRSDEVCNPETYKPVSVQARLRREVGDPNGFLTLADVRKDGFITPEAFARITKQATRKS